MLLMVINRIMDRALIVEVTRPTVVRHTMDKAVIVRVTPPMAVNRIMDRALIARVTMADTLARRIADRAVVRARTLAVGVTVSDRVIVQIDTMPEEQTDTLRTTGIMELTRVPTTTITGI
jgi:hypothetical protein